MQNTIEPLKNIAEQLGTMLPSVPRTQRVTDNGRQLVIIKNIKVSKDTSESQLVETALVYVKAAVAVHTLKEEAAAEAKRAEGALQDKVSRRFFGPDWLYAELPSSAARRMVDHIIALEASK